MGTSVFRTEAGRDKLRAYYNGVLNQLPFEKRYLDTTFGRTFLLSAGNASSPPIILLHGSCSNSAFWFPEIMGLSGSYRVHAVDIIGEAGNSDEYRPDLDSDAFAAWMGEVLDALGIERAIVAGNSLGGWMALKFATSHPERVSKLVLIASSGISQIQGKFTRHAWHKQEEGGEDASADISIAGGQGLPKEVLDFLGLIVESYEPIQDLPLFSDEQLQRLKMPVLFIGGEDDAIIDAKSSARRLSRLVPTAITRLLPGCGHVVTNSLAYMIPFIS